MEKAETPSRHESGESTAGFPRLVAAALATCQFELYRNCSFQRMSVGLMLGLFPPLILTVVLFAPRVANAQPFPLPELLAVILSGLVSFLSMLLWTATIIDSDLEGKTWSYLASRPGGRTSNLIGKFAAGTIQSFAVSLISISGCTIALSRAGVLTMDSIHFFMVLAIVFALAALSYNSVLSMIGTVFFRRSMIGCVAWALVSEVFLANIPAVIRFASVRYHLQEVLLRMIDWPLPRPEETEEGYRLLFGDYGMMTHLLCLGAIATASMGLAIFWVNHKEYLLADEA